MEKYWKPVLIVILLVSSFTVLIFYSFGVIDFTGGDGEAEEVNVQGLSLTVDYNNGSVKMRKNFTLSEKDASALAALEKWCEVEYEQYPSGDVFVKSIYVQKNEGKYYWLYYVNGEFAGVGASSYELEDGD